jgi:hypothetical protein
MFEIYFYVMNSKHPYTWICTKLCIHSNSSVAINRRILLFHMNDDGTLLNTNHYNIAKSRICSLNNGSDDNVYICNLIRELCSMRDGIYSCNLKPDEITYMLRTVCKCMCVRIQNICNFQYIISIRYNPYKWFYNLKCHDSHLNNQTISILYFVSI